MINLSEEFEDKHKAETLHNETEAQSDTIKLSCSSLSVTEKITSHNGPIASPS